MCCVFQYLNSYDARVDFIGRDWSRVMVDLGDYNSFLR